MKTFARLIRRYVLAAVAITTLLLALALGGFLFLGYHYGVKYQADGSYSASQIANSMVETDGGLSFGPQHTAAEWMRSYEWAMVLDDAGNVIWQYDLPAELAHAYTVGEVAVFSKSYLDDYPVFCQARDYGLLVLGKAKGSIWRYNYWTYTDIIVIIRDGILPTLFGAMGVILLCCLLFSWRGAKSLQAISDGLETLAGGGTVLLPVQGFTGEVAQRLNQTSAQLQRRNEIIAQRDSARTSWIAGVSHDIRTPLALILGWAEQLEHDEALPDAARHKAGGIRTQSEKIRSLIEDLNLTSKLQYGAQPLRRQKTPVGPFLRQAVAAFYETPLAEHCTVELTLSDEAERAVLDADTALLTRALENLLNNSARHNAAPVCVTLTGEVCKASLRLTVADDGSGYPPAVLRALRGAEGEENRPHILGLHVVEQIVQAHGGSTVFTQNTPHGAKTILTLPL